MLGINLEFRLTEHSTFGPSISNVSKTWDSRPGSFCFQSAYAPHRLAILSRTVVKSHGISTLLNVNARSAGLASNEGHADGKAYKREYEFALREWAAKSLASTKRTAVMPRGPE